MIDYGRQKSTVKPEEIEITENMVFIASGISEITEEGTDSQPGFAGYEFDLVGYDKDEYIKLQATSNKQHLDRGIKEITAYCEQNNLELEKIFTDQQTGKNFNRPRYQVLKEDVSRAGDKLIITEVDNFTSYKNYNIWLIELKRNISGKVICVTRGDTNWKDKSR